MAVYGLTPQGFNPKPLAAILSDAHSVQLAKIDPNLDLNPTNPLEVLNGILAQSLDELWQAEAALYSGMDPDAASDDQLTSVGLLTGTVREGPRPTLVVGCVVNVDAGFNAAPGTMFAAIVGNGAAVFTNKEAVSNPGGAPANETVDFVAVNNGPQQCLAGTLTVKSSPLTGWNTITNANDGIVGASVESDPPFRIRRQQELQTAGSSTADAIRSAIFTASQNKVFSSDVVSCTVLYNDGDLVDANGVPPHSIEVIAYQPGNTGGDDQLLANLIFNSKGAGIGTWGGAVKTVTDSQGFIELVRFTRPTPTRIYVAITVLTDPKLFPIDGVLETQEAIAADGNAIGEGNNVYAKQVQSAAFTVPGVKDVTLFKIDTVSPPVATGNIVMNIRSIATFATADVAVTVT